MKLVSSQDVQDKYEADFNNCIIRYGDMKKQLAEDIIKFTTPIREKIISIKNDKEYLSKVVKQGAEKARESASKTLKGVREIIGFRAF